MFHRMLARLALLAGACLATAAHADDGIIPVPTVPGVSSVSSVSSGPASLSTGEVRPYLGAAARTSTTLGGGVTEPSPLDPQRWLPLLGTSGMVSYFDQSAVRRRGAEVGVVLIHNAPAGVIKTTGGETIRSSLKRLVLNCATSMYAVVEQTLYSRRFARGESLYTIRLPQYGKLQMAQSGTIAGELIGRLCR
ncbi:MULTISPECIES: surface-adhesin E family protein [unclassified Cupriavidus]|uniref:surface-adhesin E family protein n=1 Tax=Cupriavidus sp. H19C3 TaxID=3241603 RepID=UPI003BF855C8